MPSPAAVAVRPRPEARVTTARLANGHRDRQAFYEGLALRRRRAQIAARRALEAGSEPRARVG